MPTQIPYCEVLPQMVRHEYDLDREKGITSESTTIKEAFWLDESCYKGGGDRQLSMENIYYMYMAQKRPGLAIWKKGRGVKSMKINTCKKR